MKKGKPQKIWVSSRSKICKDPDAIEQFGLEYGQGFDAFVSSRLKAVMLKNKGMSLLEAADVVQSELDALQKKQRGENRGL